MDEATGGGALWPVFPGGLGLVSTSPRRSELLERIGARFRVIPPDEGTEGGEESDPIALVLGHAEAKARSVAGTAGEEALLAADTIVVREGSILGKPTNDGEASEMLRFLSGGRHQVVTGVFALHRPSGATASGAETTDVFFRDLGEEEIASYVASGEPSDKAGAYGIQGLGSLLVERIEGCYFNVVGLPLVRTREVLAALAGAAAKKGR